MKQAIPKITPSRPDSHRCAGNCAAGSRAHENGNGITDLPFQNFTEGFSPPPGEVYQRIESPRGELGFFVASDGSPKPYRVKVRAPSFANLQGLAKLCEGRMLADVVACIGTIDIVLGEVDR